MNAPYVTSDMKKLPSEDVAYYKKIFKDAKNADDTHRMRGIRNMKAYTSVNDGQWDERLKSEMRREGRSPNSYNFIQFIVRGHVGNYIMNAIDPKFIDREGDGVNANPALEALQKKYYADKEHYNYQASSIQAFEDGLVYRGVEELTIERPSNDPQEWGINFEPLRHDMVIFDPSNMSDRISRDAKKAWKMPFLTPAQMLRLFPEKEGKILKALAGSVESNGETFEELHIDMYEHIDETAKFGDKYMCVEYFHIKDIKEKRQFIGDIELPKSEFRFDSQEDITFKIEWALRNGIEINDELMWVDEFWKPCLYLTTFCPKLGIVLENRKDERQLDGKLPFYAWSFIQKWGVSVGLVDLLYDPQADLNKREMAKTKFITNAPHGKMWLSEDIVGDSDRKLDEYVAEANDISKPYITPEGMPGSNMFGVVNGANINPAILQDINEKADWLNKIGSLPPAMQGFTGNSAESGIAIGRKVIEGSIMQRRPIQAFIQHENDKAEDWVKMAIKLYSGPANYNRVVNSGDDKPIVMNELVGYDESGEDVVKNDIRKLKRLEVIISESAENDYLKQAQREMDVAALQAIVPSPQNDPIRAAFECSLASRMDFTDDVEKEKVVDACKKRLQLANATADLQLAQVKSALSQMQAQQAQMGGEQQPGMPTQEGQAQPEMMMAQSPNQPSNVLDAQTMNTRNSVPEVER